MEEKSLTDVIAGLLASIDFETAPQAARRRDAAELIVSRLSLRSKTFVDDNDEARTAQRIRMITGRIAEDA